MKQSTFTGYHIWNQIQTINTEIREIDQAMCEIERDSLAYNLLKKELQKRKDQWNEMQKTKYVISEE